MNKKKFAEYQQTIKQPIFIIGGPRCGTTLLYAILCAHPNLGWFSTRDLKDWFSIEEQQRIKKQHEFCRLNNKKIVRSEQALLVFGDNFSVNLDTFARLLPHPIPIEGQKFLHKIFGSNYVKDIRIDSKIEFAKKIVSLLEREKKERFINKSPMHFTRLIALQKCFPDTKFINIIREPRAVIYSSIKRFEEEGTFGEIIPIKNLSVFQNLDSVEKWAWKYKEISETIYQFSQSPNNKNIITVIYEELIKNPEETVKKIFRFCELKIPQIDKILPPFRNSLEQWKRSFNVY